MTPLPECKEIMFMVLFLIRFQIQTVQKASFLMLFVKSGALLSLCL